MNNARRWWAPPATQRRFWWNPTCKAMCRVPTDQQVWKYPNGWTKQKQRKLQSQLGEGFDRLEYCTHSTPPLTGSINNLLFGAIPSNLRASDLIAGNSLHFAAAHSAQIAWATIPFPAMIQWCEAHPTWRWLWRQWLHSGAWTHYRPPNCDNDQSRTKRVDTAGEVWHQKCLLHVRRGSHSPSDAASFPANGLIAATTLVNETDSWTLSCSDACWRSIVAAHTRSSSLHSWPQPILRLPIVWPIPFPSCQCLQQDTSPLPLPYFSVPFRHWSHRNILWKNLTISCLYWSRSKHQTRKINKRGFHCRSEL